MTKTILTTATFLSLCSAASAATIATTVTQDTYIRNDGGGAGTPQNGDPDLEILVGSNGSTNNLRGLITFDVIDIVNAVNTTGGGDWSNLTINSATVTFYERRGFAFTDPNIQVNTYGFDFLEGTATWNAPAVGDVAGGTIGTLLGSSASFGFDSTADNDDGSVTLNGALLADAIENASTAGTLNFIITTTSAATTFSSFTSDEFGNSARHTALNIDYTVVPEPSSVALLGLGGLALISRRRK